MSVLNDFAKLLKTKIIITTPLVKSFFYSLEYASKTRDITEEKIHKTIDQYCEFSRKEISIAKSHPLLPYELKTIARFEKELDRLTLDHTAKTSLSLISFSLFKQKHILLIDPNKPFHFSLASPYPPTKIDKHNILICFKSTLSGVILLENPKIPDDFVKALNDYKDYTNTKSSYYYSKMSSSPEKFLRGTSVSGRLSELIDAFSLKESFHSIQPKHLSIKKNHSNDATHENKNSLTNQSRWRNITANGPFSFNAQKRRISSRRYSKPPKFKPFEYEQASEDPIELDPNNVTIEYNLGTEENPIEIDPKNVTITKNRNVKHTRNKNWVRTIPTKSKKFTPSGKHSSGKHSPGKHKSSKHSPGKVEDI